MDPQQQFVLFGITPEVFTPAQQALVNDLFLQGLDYLYIRSQATAAGAWHQLLAGIAPDFYHRLLLPANAPAEAAEGKYRRHIREREREQGLGRSQVLRELSPLPSTNFPRYPSWTAGINMFFTAPFFPVSASPDTRRRRS
jgi:thiamine-phosphate pyrophosphorylase